MYRLYLVTGATGYLGISVVNELLKIGADVRALVMPNDSLRDNLPKSVKTVYGRVDDISSLQEFFDESGQDCCVIHCAGVVSIASKPDERLKSVNVYGTQNVISMCRGHNIGKLVYVSSVHAIPEKPKGNKISETRDFSPNYVSGYYAKSKASATEAVLSAAKEGLNACVVHPSGIIGPNDNGNGSITYMIRSYLAGKMPFGVRGGFDFVDVRDVACGIVSCCENGKNGECYILSNRFVSIRELLETIKAQTNGRRILAYLPLSLAKLFAPIVEKHCLKKKRQLYFTPYSIETLGTNAMYSHERATKDLGYKPRSIALTIADTVAWLKHGRIIKEK